MVLLGCRVQDTNQLDVRVLADRLGGCTTAQQSNSILQPTQPCCTLEIRRFKQYAVHSSHSSALTTVQLTKASRTKLLDQLFVLVELLEVLNTSGVNSNGLCLFAMLDIS